MQIFIGNVVEELETLVVTSDNTVALLGTKLVESIVSDVRVDSFP